MSRRPITRPVLRVVALLAAVAAGGSIAAGAQAQTDGPLGTIEGWFSRAKERAPQVETPAGPVSPGEMPAPQAPDTGAYVVSSLGGNAGPDQGDTGWAAFQWDLLDAMGGTVERFEVTFTQAPDNRLDHGTPVFQACTIIEPWGAAPGSNPWVDRPTPACAEAVVPEQGEDGAGRATYTFDLTEMAQGWVDGEGFGVVLVPGTPDQDSGLPAFQLTLAGYANASDARDEVRPRVVFEFSGGLDDGFGEGGGDGFGFDGGGFDGGGFADPAPFDPQDGIDVFPDDVGSVPLPEDEAAGGDETAAPAPGPSRPRTVPAANTGFPLAGWLLVVVAAAAFWASGTALGPAGEPVPVREGGVSRLLARRRSDPIPQGG